MAWFNGPQLYYTSTTELSDGTLPDTDKVAADAAELEVDDEITEATTLTLPVAGTLGSTIAWTSSDDAVINATTGAVVLPASGQVTITLTATVTLNSAEVETTFEVLVGVPETPVSGASDLFFSEYIEGTSSHKALEIFNGTGADVDLSVYSINQYSNGASTPNNTLDLTGTLANGDVYVVYNSNADQDIVDEGDVTSSVTFFNGNDAIELLKNDVVIDVIGEVGVDEYWTVGTGSTEDHTLVRAETITDPNTVFTASEWVVYAVDTFDHIGSHTMVAPVTTYTQDFGFLTTSTNSYSTSVQHTDTNGFDWDLLGRQNIGSWMLGNAEDGSYIEITATGGISTFTADFVRAFTNSNVRSVELFVNDVSFGTFTIDPSSDTAQNWLVEDINVSGDVVIKLVSTSPGSRGAFSVDNIEWTTF